MHLRLSMMNPYRIPEGGSSNEVPSGFGIVAEQRPAGREPGNIIPRSTRREFPRIPTLQFGCLCGIKGARFRPNFCGQSGAHTPMTTPPLPSASVLDSKKIFYNRFLLIVA